MTLPEIRDRSVKIFNILDDVYPDAGPTINFSNPFELLVASIIGARATDESVNRVTKTLFKKYPTPESLAVADYDTLFVELHDLGLADVKARYLIETSKILQQRYNSTIPCSMKELTDLPGVGRKIANMVLGNACNQPAMIVDTHVNRVSYRLGLTGSTNPVIADRELKDVLPEECWTRWNFLMIAHGRRICVARNPRCAMCQVLHQCPYGTRRIQGLAPA
ncbi:MAG: endonuclease III domain-containing protein [Armatimonadota bacterium]